MKFSTAFSLLAALPLALAAPTCSLKKTSTASAASPTPTTVTTPTSPSSGNTTTGAGTNGKIAMAWFADWHPNYFVSNISWSHYTHMAFFTAQPSSDATVEVVLDDPSMVDQFTAAAHANGVKALLTVGGWSTGIYWSSSVTTASNRSTFATSLVQYANAHGFDGLDFDWEYPGKQGIGCNTMSPDDTENFLSFIQEIRGQAPNLTYSAAVSVTPFTDSTGAASTNVSGFAGALDWIEIMNYDVFGTFSSVDGPNAPLNDTCAPSQGQGASAVSAVAAWTAAGFPANQIVLGVPAYGHSYTVPASTAVTGTTTLNIYTTFDKTNIPIGDSWDPPTTEADICGNPPVGNGNSGVYNFWALIGDGFLNEDGSVASSMLSLYDDCSQTPFVYNPSNQIMVSYDNAQSFTAKGQYINQAGLLGFSMYEAGGDYNNILVSAINTGMGSS
ncbi:glycoside hydrolase family 18 protein [Hydnomerulius pinastri MD-312]|uniref:Unplaced genomic scaffold scaffold_18, whole genome shotgun sequence n=1 Tax=Hydnomerulius pinastri MD-312 TaxID=994086 RepID=A0A0C9WEC8_9AGAM|nr:glycoside hydrolase family 18 protein [Hydnomerulius pinastri MD-312]